MHCTLLYIRSNLRCLAVYFISYTSNFTLCFVHKVRTCRVYTIHIPWDSSAHERLRTYTYFPHSWSTHRCTDTHTHDRTHVNPILGSRDSTSTRDSLKCSQANTLTVTIYAATPPAQSIALSTYMHTAIRSMVQQTEQNVITAWISHTLALFSANSVGEHPMAAGISEARHDVTILNDQPSTIHRQLPASRHWLV